MIIGIVLFLAFGLLAVLVGLPTVVFASIFAFRNIRSGRVQFMDRKDWKRVRQSLNESHEETQVAVATDHLRGLLADE